MHLFMATQLIPTVIASHNRIQSSNQRISSCWAWNHCQKMFNFIQQQIQSSPGIIVTLWNNFMLDYVEIIYSQNYYFDIKILQIFSYTQSRAMSILFIAKKQKIQYGVKAIKLVNFYYNSLEVLIFNKIKYKSKILVMNSAKNRMRPKSSVDVRSIYNNNLCILRPVSSLFFLPYHNNLSNSRSQLDIKQNKSLLGSSVWRSVVAARCEQHLKKQQLQPIRKNLSQKITRLKAKRQQQQKKYECTISNIRKKCGGSSSFQNYKFIQTHNIISQWADEKKLQYNRYRQRLLKLKH